MTAAQQVTSMTIHYWGKYNYMCNTINTLCSYIANLMTFDAHVRYATYVEHLQSVVQSVIQAHSSNSNLTEHSLQVPACSACKYQLAAHASKSHCSTCKQQHAAHASKRHSSTCKQETLQHVQTRDTAAHASKRHCSTCKQQHAAHASKRHCRRANKRHCSTCTAVLPALYSTAENERARGWSSKTSCSS